MVIYRKLFPAEWPAYRAHLLRLDGRDRRARFLAPTSDDTIRRHCDTLDPIWTLVIGAFFDGVLRGAVELCGAPNEGREQVELAVSVELGFQGHGAGGELVRRAILAAQNRGIKRIVMLCLLENRRMQYIARRSLGRLDFDEADVIGDLAVPPVSPMSLWHELINEGAAAAITLFDIWQPYRGRQPPALAA